MKVQKPDRINGKIRVTFFTDDETLYKIHSAARRRKMSVSAMLQNFIAVRLKKTGSGFVST